MAGDVRMAKLPTLMMMTWKEQDGCFQLVSSDDGLRPWHVLLLTYALSRVNMQIKKYSNRL